MPVTDTVLKICQHYWQARCACLIDEKESIDCMEISIGVNSMVSGSFGTEFGSHMDQC